MGVAGAGRTGRLRPGAGPAPRHRRRRRWSIAEFARRAQAYRRNLGFDPEAVRVRSCGEDGPKAIAHVTLMGRVDSRQRFSKDAVALRQCGPAWGVVLPRDFGRQRAR